MAKPYNNDYIYNAPKSHLHLRKRKVNEQKKKKNHKNKNSIRKASQNVKTPIPPVKIKPEEAKDPNKVFLDHNSRYQTNFANYVEKTPEKVEANNWNWHSPTRDKHDHSTKVARTKVPQAVKKQKNTTVYPIVRTVPDTVTVRTILVPQSYYNQQQHLLRRRRKNRPAAPIREHFPEAVTHLPKMIGKRENLQETTTAKSENIETFASSQPLPQSFNQIFNPNRQNRHKHQVDLVEEPQLVPTFSSLIPSVRKTPGFVFKYLNETEIVEKGKKLTQISRADLLKLIGKKRKEIITTPEPITHAEYRAYYKRQRPSHDSETQPEENSEKGKVYKSQLKFLGKESRRSNVLVQGGRTWLRAFDEGRQRRGDGEGDLMPSKEELGRRRRRFLAQNQ